MAIEDWEQHMRTAVTTRVDMVEALLPDFELDAEEEKRMEDFWEFHREVQRKNAAWWAANKERLGVI